MGAPPSLNFMGEILLLFGGICYSYYLSLLLAMLILSSGVYRIYMYTSSNHGDKRIFLGFECILMSEMLIRFSHLTPLLLICFCLRRAFLSRSFSNIKFWS